MTWIVVGLCLATYFGLGYALAYLSVMPVMTMFSRMNKNGGTVRPLSKDIYRIILPYPILALIAVFVPRAMRSLALTYWNENDFVRIGTIFLIIGVISASQVMQREKSRYRKQNTSA